MKHFPRLIVLGVIGAIFLSRPGSSDARTVAVDVGETGGRQDHALKPSTIKRVQ
ncbi:MAG: hypothetical protein WCE51_12615 [Chthoniobacterales bacterium]